MSFFAELKRRNVVKVGIAYVVASWLLLQLTEVLTELLELDTDVGKIVILLLIIGFIPALIFAWAFELTPEGIKREHEVDRSQSVTSQTSRKLDFWIIGILVIALSYFIYDKFAAGPAEPPSAAAVSQTAMEDVATEPSIAVLPFVNMSTDPEQEFFSDGISEELLNLLVRVDGLKVASRTSSFSYKGANPNIPQIAAELKVDHILEGSVRKSGNRVRITAQLIETTNDRHLWSDTFDRELDDIFTIQDEIASAIVTALKAELGVGLGDVEVIAATENLDAYGMYLKARSLFTARENLELSIQLFKRAIELDPDFARAWEGLAAVESVSSSWLAHDGIDHESRAIEAAEKALELDPDLSMPYAVIGMKLSGEGDGWIQAGRDLDKALENDPKNTTAWLWRGIRLKDLGYFEPAIADFEQCLEIDSGYLNCQQHLAEAHLLFGQTEQALVLFEETIEANFHSTSDSFVAHYLRTGNRTAALLLASMAMERLAPYAPVKDWIAALEHPDEDQSARGQRFLQWADSNNLNCRELGAVLAPLNLFRCIDLEVDGRSLWAKEAAEFRQSQEFRDLASGQYLDYWQEHGFPPQCRAIGEEDFECD